MSVNKVILLGNLGNDPEGKQTTNNYVCQFNLATSQKYKDEEKTEWHRVVVWGKMAEACARYLIKGSKVYIEGRLQTRSWEDEHGQKKYTTEVVAARVEFLSQKQEQSKPGYVDHTKDSTGNYGPEPSFDSSDEIPF